MPDRCPECGGTDDLVPVWEDPLAQMLGQQPDYVGCTNCHTMTDNA